MKYESINEFNRFEFHNSLLTKFYQNEDVVIWVLKNLNATTKNTQNTFSTDMCIEKAKLSFKNFTILKIESLGHESYSYGGKLLETIPTREIEPIDYDKVFHKMTNDQTGAYVISATMLNEREKPFTACFEISCGSELYSITASYHVLTVKWDNYSGEAWYIDTPAPRASEQTIYL